MSATPLEIAGKGKSTTKGNWDWYYGGGEEAWGSLALAKAGVPEAIRAGKTVGVLENNKIVEYIWHIDDLTDDGLVLKVEKSQLTQQEVNDYSSSVFTQLSSQMKWNIPHSLDKMPSVTVQDIEGNNIHGDVTYLDTNNLTITFSASVSGKAYLN